MTNKHPDFIGRELLHYYHTPKEMDALTGKGPGTHDHDSAICGHGAYHFARTRDRAAVTCPRCCEKLGLPIPAASLGLHARLKAAGVPCDNWHSDLYFPATAETAAIIAAAMADGALRSRPTTFVCNITGKLHYDAAFQFDPYWNRITHTPSVSAKRLEVPTLKA